MPLPHGTAGVFEPVNVAGVLFSMEDLSTPLFNMLRSVSVGHREFVVSASYSPEYPIPTPISEAASVTAPPPSNYPRTQIKNVTQIFQESVSVTYRKMSDYQSLTGVNAEGLTNNVPSELAFTIATKLALIRTQIEWTILNGIYNLATSPDEADATRGLLEAAAVNAIDGKGEELSADILIEVAKQLLYNSPYGLEGVVGILNPEQMVQLNKIILNEGQRASMAEAGSNLLTYLTPFGKMRFMEGGHRFMPNGEALFANLRVCSNVLHPVPGKGNFFYEPLAKTGAGESGQIYGQWGLNHGPSWMHAKVINLSSTTSPMTAPQVYVTNMPS